MVPLIVMTLKNSGGQGSSSLINYMLNYFTKQGRKVVAVDADNCKSLSYCTGVNNIDDAPTLWTVINGEIPIQEAIQHTSQGDIIAGNDTLKYFDHLGSDNYLENIYRVKNELQKLNSDIVLIDSAPRISGFLVESCLAAANTIVIPVEASALAMQGLFPLEEKLKLIKKHVNNEIKINGVLLSRLDPRLVLSRSMIDPIKEWAARNDTSVYKTYIPNNVAVREAQAQRISLLDYQPKSSANIAFNKFIDEFIERL